MKKQAKLMMSTLTKQASKIKVSKRIDGLEDAAFFKKKMDKASKMVAVAGIPK